MSAFTPGPWYRNIRNSGRYPTIFAGRNQHVAVATPQNDPNETEANIDLIAAAPDLLEALTIIRDLDDEWAETESTTLLSAQTRALIDAAIAKATTP